MCSGGQVVGRLHVQALQLRFQNFPPIPFCGAHLSSFGTLCVIYW